MTICRLTAAGSSFFIGLRSSVCPAVWLLVSLRAAERLPPIPTLIRDHNHLSPWLAVGTATTFWKLNGDAWTCCDIISVTSRRRRFQHPIDRPNDPFANKFVRCWADLASPSPKLGQHTHVTVTPMRSHRLLSSQLMWSTLVSDHHALRWESASNMTS